MLKLVIDNKKDENPKTCISDCVFFDPISYKCGYLDKVVLEKDPKTTQSCDHFNDRMAYLSEDEDVSEFHSVEYDWEIDDPINLFQPLEYDNYPFHPPIEPPRADATWFVSPDHTFGCWIVHHPKNNPVLISNITRKEDEFSYRSPIPLHDHASSVGLRKI